MVGPGPLRFQCEPFPSNKVLEYTKSIFNSSSGEKQRIRQVSSHEAVKPAESPQLESGAARKM